MTLIIKRFLILLSLCSLSLQAQHIKIGAAEWTGYTNADGSGIYFELLKRIYGNDKLALKLDVYNRMLADFRKGRVDIAVGIYKEDVQQAIFPRWFLDMEDPITAYYAPDTDISNLDNLTIAWIRGYQFERYIPVVKSPYLVNSYADGFKLLAKRRLDIFIDYPYNRPKQYQKKFSSFEIMPERHIYLAFQRNQLGKQLAKQFDRSMRQLRQSGELAKIFGEYYQHSQLAKFNPDNKSVTIMSKAIEYIKPKHQSEKTVEPIENKILTLVTDSIEGYNIEFQIFDSYATLAQYKNSDSICFSNLIKTTEREQDFIFSKPMMLYMGQRLFSKSPINTEQPVNLTDFMAADKQKILGLVENQSYGGTLDQQLRQIDTKQIAYIPVDTPANLKIFNAGRFDYRIGYPSVINHYWPEISHDKLYSYAITGAEPFILGHLMCSKDSAPFIAKFNDKLTSLYPSTAFYNFHYAEIDEDSRNDFKKYFSQTFLKSDR